MRDQSTDDPEATTGPVAADTPPDTPGLKPTTTPGCDSKPTTPGATTHKWGTLPAIPGYEMLREIGRGGMGVVYLARQQELKRLVAVKMIRTDGPAGVEQVERFRTEAEAVAQLRDPHIVQIYAIDKLDVQPFCVLEYVDGGNLAQRLAGIPQPPRAAAELVKVLARAMHTAHTKGIVHRDLKPANVLLTSESQPKITDFGLAKLLDTPSGQTQSGAVLGTPSYMAPEQAAGMKVGPAADVYALGAILYEMLTGRPPFRGATLLETLEQVRAREPVPPSQLQPKLPEDLETICLKCLQKEPLRRYASATALAADLERFLKGEPIVARPIGGGERLWRWCRRNPRLAASLAAVFLALLIGAVGTTYGMLRAQAQQRLTEVEAKQRVIESYQAAAHVARERGAWRDVLRFYDQALAAGSDDTMRLRLDRLRALNAIGDRAQVASEVAALLARPDAAEVQGELLLWQAENELFSNTDVNVVVNRFTAALSHTLPEAERAYAEAMRSESAVAALPHLRNALKADRHHQQARSVLALLLLSLGRFDEAGSEAAIGVVLFPEDQNFRLALALMHAFQGDRQAAQAELAHCREQFGNDWAERVQASLDIILEFCQNLGGGIKDLPTQDRLIAAIMKLQPGTPASTAGAATEVGLIFPPPLSRLVGHIKSAFLAVMANSMKDADRELEQACQQHPEGVLLNLYGQFLVGEDRHAEAEKAFVKAADAPALMPVKRQSLFMAVMACQLQHDALTKQAGGPNATSSGKDAVGQRGVNHVRSLRSLGPLRGEEFYYCTLMAMKSKDLGLARQIIIEWQPHGEKDWRHWWLESELGVREENFAQAHKAAQKTLELKPGHPRSQEILQLARDGLARQLKEVTQAAK